MGPTIILMFGWIESSSSSSFNHAEPGRPTGLDLAGYYITGLFISIGFNVLISYPTAKGLEQFVKKCKSPRSRMVAGLIPLELLVLCVLTIGAYFVFDCLHGLFYLIPFLSISALGLLAFSFYWMIFWLAGSAYQKGSSVESGATDVQQI